MGQPAATGHSPCLKLRGTDNVAVATADLAAGTDIDAGGTVVELRDAIPAGHKVATEPIASGETVFKYGHAIGRATREIRPGEHVHSHNLGFSGHEESPVAATDRQPVHAAPALSGPSSGGLETATFEGIVRPDGRVATRNYIGILTSVNCSATVARMVAANFRPGSALMEPFGHVDGVVALTHGSGCGMAGTGEGFEILRRTLSGYARHPNFSGLLVLGLGCEVNEVRSLSEGFELPPTTPVATMTVQGSGGTRATITQATDKIGEMLGRANEARRTTVPVSEIVLGLECGGSDGYSGITANPALGVAADLLVAHGGTSVLGETPEIYGAEHLLARRAVNDEVAAQLLARIRWWEQYVARSGASMDNNPSPGNKAGGLTTILEKSLGAVAKGGGSPLSAVYEYAEAVEAKGFVFMDTPGYDPVSVTGMVAGGANVVCFTTGRGSVFGSKPAPCIKLATNSQTFHHMEEDMDVNCGAVIDGEATLEQKGREIFDLVVSVASGRRTKSEELGFGDEEFTPWQLGAVL